LLAPDTFPPADPDKALMRRSYKDFSMFSTALRRSLFTIVGIAAASTASAGTITTWSGTGANNNWSTNGNWTTTPTVSGTTYSLVYRGNPTRTTSANNLGGAVSVDSILFANTGATGSTSAFILSRSATTPALSLVNGATITTTAATTGTLSDTISSGLTFGGTATFNMGSNHNLTLSGTLSGGGSLVKTGAGDLLLTGTNDLAALSIEQGVVQVNATAFGTSLLRGINDLVVDIGSSGETGTFRTAGVGGVVTPVSTNMQFRLNGNANITPNSTSNINFNAANFNEAVAGVTTPVTLSLIGGAGGSNGTQNINGAIQDNSGTGKVNVTIGTANSQNAWVLNGINTYTGDTTVAAGGKLLMNGTIDAASTTTSYGYLGGSGTFGGAVIVSSGTLNPGGVSVGGGIIDSLASLTVASLSLGSSATTQLTITGSTTDLYEQIIGSSTLNYGGTLALTLTDNTTSYDTGTVFNLFTGFTGSPTGNLSAVTLDAVGTDFDGITTFYQGTDGDWYTGWDGLNGAVAAGWTSGGQSLKFSQTTGTLTVVPEPSTIVFAGIGMAMFGWSTWTRRRAKSRRQAIEAAIA
jgi:autotransporter-associated beta strand protein